MTEFSFFGVNYFFNWAYNQSAPKINTKLVLIERKQVDKRLNLRFGGNIE